ncbi:ABC transporter substrate-binding protein [Microvirga tunisiensis]|uniref:ABC transporter substrate-binding protein n=1 Tax=Microvirga tunisiensis TaxID=2108360 RepID=A0A5N7MF59_9HYPH|nr:ABC transporter substrate-binding protein [Microvirga tunisiensis]MPR06661.1 ABC transporter substrate-binding protein [Microvirga tunisiensis]MPR24774.1 ABC transporter substrate-binding protein [Microvirga tunisiensis]
MLRRTFINAASAAAAMLALSGAAASAQETLKIGLILPMTGPFASTGRQIEAAAKLYMQQKGDTVAGKKVQLILKDDTGTADVTKRLAQELIVQEKVSVLAGFGLTPLALATAPLATQAKVPEVVMAAATSIIPEQSPYIVRSSFTAAQVTVPLAEWAAKEGLKRVVTIVSDYGPGIDVEKAFTETFTKAGGQVENLRVPLANPDFSPFLQKVADAKPDALLAFVPSGVGAQFMKQFVERGLDKSGIRFLAEGSVTDDDLLNSIGDVALGAVTSHHYSAAHDSPENKAFVEAFKKANNGMRPNFMAVGGYDGMHLIYEGLKKTNGAGGQALIDAMKGMSWTSPRGPVSIDPQTRDIIQNIYVRKVERKDGELYNVEFATIPNVKDPVKAAKSN